MTSGAGLTETQADLFVQFAQASVSVRDAEGFKQLVNEFVKPLLPHGSLLAVIGKITFGQVEIYKRLSINYPEWALAQIPSQINIRERPVIARWLQNRQPAVLDLPADRALFSDREANEVIAFGLGRLAVHGVPDLSGHMASYFSFAQVDVVASRSQLQRMLSLLCPLLHMTLTRIPGLEVTEKAKPVSLTAIERELLMLLAAGRTNAEMAAVRGKSPATVRNQLEKLYAKLSVSSRAEAVALIISQGTNCNEWSAE